GYRRAFRVLEAVRDGWAREDGGVARAKRHFGRRLGQYADLRGERPDLLVAAPSRQHQGIGPFRSGNRHAFASGKEEDQECQIYFLAADCLPVGALCLTRYIRTSSLF